MAERLKSTSNRDVILSKFSIFINTDMQVKANQSKDWKIAFPLIGRKKATRLQGL